MPKTVLLALAAGHALAYRQDVDQAWEHAHALVDPQPDEIPDGQVEGLLRQVAKLANRAAWGAML